jgi:hypothetical protein
MVDVHTIHMLGVSLNPLSLFQLTSVARLERELRSCSSVSHFTMMKPTYLLREADNHIHM